MARINVIFTDRNSGTVLTQANNQEGVNLTELTGEAYDKRVYDLLERTAHRLYGPNGMCCITGFKAKGKNAGFHGIVGHKVRGRPHLFSNPREVCITFEIEGKTFLKALEGKLPEEQVAPVSDTSAS
jgi:hypothetical protein